MTTSMLYPFVLMPALAVTGVACIWLGCVDTFTRAQQCVLCAAGGAAFGIGMIEMTRSLQ